MENLYQDPEHLRHLNPRKIRVIKAKARENLLGNYGPIIGGTLLISVIFSILNSFLSLGSNNPMQYVIFYAADFIIAMLIQFFYVGIYAMHLNAARGQASTISELFYPIKNGTNRFLGVAVVMTLISLIQGIPQILLLNQFDFVSMLYGDMPEPNVSRIFVLSILTIIGAIISIYLYFTFILSSYFLMDNPQMSAKDALIQSYRHMKGNKFRLLLQQLSFIGLYLLGLLTLGIAYLWITPYRDQAVTVFYETLTGFKQAPSSTGEDCISENRN